MQRKKVWRYYCEYCKKSGCSGGHIRRHEASCTNNPNRICRMCKLADSEQKPMPVLLEAVNRCTEQDIGPLREAAEWCPVCMLAAIRQSGRQTPPDENGDGFSFHFDFRSERNSFFADIYSEGL